MDKFTHINLQCTTNILAFRDYISIFVFMILNSAAAIICLRFPWILPSANFRHLFVCEYKRAECKQDLSRADGLFGRTLLYHNDDGDCNWKTNFRVPTPFKPLGFMILHVSLTQKYGPRQNELNKVIDGSKIHKDMLQTGKGGDLIAQ